MAANRITIVNNANQTLKCTLVLKQATFEDLLVKAKNKLKLKKTPKRLFARNENNIKELKKGDIISNDCEIIVSMGEEYIGSSNELSNSSCTEAENNLICNKANVEKEAIEQLERVGKFDGMLKCVGMPDLHPGLQYPIGAAFISNIIYPPLIGGDIGCGMTFLELNLSADTLEQKPSRFADKINDIEGKWTGDMKELRKDFELEPTEFDDSIGTIGRGNHFAELLVVHQIHDQNNFKFNIKKAFLLVHSGSRGLGKAVLEAHTKDGKIGLHPHSPEASLYIKDHNNAMKWAKANRMVIAKRVCESLQTQGYQILDIFHNTVTELQDGAYLHRKGAAPSDCDLVIIPGSRGTLSYLVKPIGDQSKNAFSVAHGAGRQLGRNKALLKFGNLRNTKDSLRNILETNQYGGFVICDDFNLLCEEFPDAYKDIDSVVADLVASNIVIVVATFRPIVTYKMREKLTVN